MHGSTKSMSFNKSCALKGVNLAKGALAIRRIFSLVDMITKPKFSK